MDATILGAIIGVGGTVVGGLMIYLLETKRNKKEEQKAIANQLILLKGNIQTKFYMIAESIRKLAVVDFVLQHRKWQDAHPDATLPEKGYVQPWQTEQYLKEDHKKFGEMFVQHVSELKSDVSVFASISEQPLLEDVFEKIRTYMYPDYTGITYYSVEQYQVSGYNAQEMMKVRSNVELELSKIFVEGLELMDNSIKEYK